MPARAPSIRRQLLARLMAPLVCVMLVAAGSAYGLARHFSQTVLDHWLYDSAVSLANRVRWAEGRASVDLPEGAREILEWDVVDRVYYEVTTGDGERLVGNAFLPPPPRRAEPDSPVYYDARLGDARVRVLAIAHAAARERPVIVLVAETQLKRKALASQVLWISVVLALVLAGLSAALVWYGIGSGMASIEAAVRDVRARHAASPLSPLPADGGVPQEVLPLVQEINDLIEDLSAAHRLNQRFIADAAHQLRTPLAGLRVQLDLALREHDAKRQRAGIEEAVAILGRMARTLHQLLTLAKADESGASAASLAAPLDLDALAREELERRIDEALAAGIDLGYAAPRAPVTVQGVDALVREAVSNLIDNALRYGGRGAHVTVGVSSSPPELYVEDDGPGIPPAERPRAIERFYRVPGAKGDGCGLGLSIAAEIVRRHGGRLVLESASAQRGLRARLVFG